MSLTTRSGSNSSINLAKARAAAAAVCPSGVSGPGGGYTVDSCAPVNANPSASTASRHLSQVSTSTSCPRRPSSRASEIAGNACPGSPNAATSSRNCPSERPIALTLRGTRYPLKAEMAKRRNNAQRLRNAVYAMPGRTKAAMLRGIRSNRVIVGAYVDKRGGVCPMLAAHRNGGRTNFGTFARAWDAYTGANQRKPRRASRREVRTLEGYLEMSLVRDGIELDTETHPDRPLREEVRDVQATRRRLAEAEAREGSDVSVQDVLATTYEEHSPSETSAEHWAAELERADAHPEPTDA